MVQLELPGPAGKQAPGARECPVVLGVAERPQGLAQGNSAFASGATKRERAGVYLCVSACVVCVSVCDAGNGMW